MGSTVQGHSTERFEWLKCSESAAYFIHNYCYIYDATAGQWIPFELWPEQLAVLEKLVTERLNVILKARQLGLTWLVLCYILWRMIFHPTFTALIFSRRETEAIYLLSEGRLRGIYNHLPPWAKVRQILTDSSHVWQLSNNSVVYAFPTSAGDSYTASFAFVDEADLVPDLSRLMNAVKPTIDGGGGMVLLSRADKLTPSSLFKRTYRGARAHTNGWAASFLPWSARPSRDMTWYEAQKADIQSRTGALDDLYQQYPTTDEEALKPPTLDRRLPFTWLTSCYRLIGEPKESYLGLPDLVEYKAPEEYHEYVIGADPAEGNPGSDPSAAYVLDVDTGEEVAKLSGRIEPSTFADYLYQLARYYNNADLLVERNNHGHAVILALTDTHDYEPMLGWDGRPGWMTSTRGKSLMYSESADAFRDNDTVIHSEEAFTQLVSIEGSSLSAPEGSHDDEATAYCLALCARKRSGATVETGRSPTDGYRG